MVTRAQHLPDSCDATGHYFSDITCSQSGLVSCFSLIQVADSLFLRVQPTWTTCSLSSSSSSTSSASRRLLEDFTQEHLAQRRKLLVDPADKDSVITATESLKGKLCCWVLWQNFVPRIAYQKCQYMPISGLVLLHWSYHESHCAIAGK